MRVTSEFQSSCKLLIVNLEATQNDKLHEVAKLSNIEEKFPCPYHITFGYRYNALSNEDLMELEIEVNAIFNTVYDKHNRRQLTLEPTKLCFFNDMTSFEPWDADTNPF